MMALTASRIGPPSPPFWMALAAVADLRSDDMARRTPSGLLSLIEWFIMKGSLRKRGFIWYLF